MGSRYNWQEIAKVSFLFVLLRYQIIGTTAFPEIHRGSTINEFQGHDDEILKIQKRQSASSDLKIDFETAGDKDNYFTISPTSTGYSLSRSTAHYKSGSNSLLWAWPTRAQSSTKVKLTLDFGTNTRTGKELSRGGIKFWMYRANKSPKTTMQIVFVGTDKSSTATRSSPTDVTLDFKGWRAVWIGYAEFPSGQFDLSVLSSIEFEITTLTADSLFIDLVQIVGSLKKQSRDTVVRRTGQLPSPSPSPSPPPFYSAKSFWQQTLRWYEEEVPQPPDEIPDKPGKISDITKIESRLENWYLSTTEAVSSLEQSTTTIKKTSGYDFRAAKSSRWSTLSADIKKAHDKYNNIQFSNKRPTLFASKSGIGENDISTGDDAMTPFGYVFPKVLLPLALEYNLRTRDAEKKFLANTYCSDLLNQAVTTSLPAVEKIAGTSAYMKGEFKKLVDAAKVRTSNPLNCNKVSERIPSMEAVIDELNDLRFKRIKALLEFLQEQGWAEGSAIGSLDHEMNKCGSGFMHSMFLLRTALRTETNLFNSLVGAMKWYNEFNEIYQEEDNYVYDGTTADRARTILFFRLMIILIDNTDQDRQITDLNYLKTWFKHAVKFNKGLGGLVKPDYTGFHHQTFYGPAYVQHALHNLALVQYFLDGTSFAVDETSKSNIRKSLEVMRMVSVKYSTPNGIGGRFPGYKRASLVKHIPAYAYSSYANAHGTTAEAVDKPEMFLRLFDTSNSDIDAFLKDGKIPSTIFYWNTIGSIDVLVKASTLSCTENPPCTAERSPSGHWSKNFAALSIHRRQDWCVAAKGFGRYVWDYESSPTQNVFGVFASHGSLQISNSESALDVYDIDNGWDWTRVPGTTTIKMDIDQAQTSKARNYNYEGKFAGGVSIIGSSATGRAQNGAFGMHLVKPDYQMKGSLENTPLDDATFEFKKSYFFYGDLIVCLGSDIKLGGVQVNTNYAQTTLFQDKLIDPETSTIKISKTTFNFNDNQNFKKTFQTGVTKKIEDTHGNVYEVKTGDNILTVEINTQTSKKSNGKSDTSGNYAVVYLKHQMATTTKKRKLINPRIMSQTKRDIADEWVKEVDDEDDDDHDNDNEDLDANKKQSVGSSVETYSYRYAIVIAGASRSLFKKYSVIRQDSKAHAIKLTGFPGLSSTTTVYGYSIFEDITSAPLTDGPVRIVDAPCMIMAEKDGTTLHLAISDPTIKFGDDPSMVNKNTCTDFKPKTNLYSPKTSGDLGPKMLFCVEGKASDEITVTLNVGVQSIVSTKVDGKTTSQNPRLNTTNSAQPKLIFSNLVNGFTTEVKLITLS